MQMKLGFGGIFTKHKSLPAIIRCSLKLPVMQKPTAFCNLFQQTPLRTQRHNRIPQRMKKTTMLEFKTYARLCSHFFSSFFLKSDLSSSASHLQTLPAPFIGADRRALYMWTKVQSTVNLPFSQEADRPGGMRLVINPMGMFTILWLAA